MWIPRQWLSHVCRERGDKHKKHQRDVNTLTECVFLVLCRLPQTKASIVLFHSPVYTVSEPFIHFYSQVIRASYVEINEEAFIDVVGNEFEQVHHLPCQTEPTVLGSDRNRGYVSVVFKAFTFGFPED